MFPKVSINVLLPTPGTPVIPIRSDLFAYGKHALTTSFAFSKWLALVLSTKVIARLRAVMLPAKIPSVSSFEVGISLRRCTIFSAEILLTASGWLMPSFSFNVDLLEFGCATTVVFLKVKVRKTPFIKANSGFQI